MNQTQMSPNKKSDNLAKAKGYKTLISSDDIKEQIAKETKQKDNVEAKPIIVDMSSKEPLELLKRMIWLIEDLEYGSLNDIAKKNRNLKEYADTIKQEILSKKIK